MARNNRKWCQCKNNNSPTTLCAQCRKNRKIMRKRIIAITSLLFFIVPTVITIVLIILST